MKNWFEVVEKQKCELAERFGMFAGIYEENNGLNWYHPHPPHPPPQKKRKEKREEEEEGYWPNVAFLCVWVIYDEELL